MISEQIDRFHAAMDRAIVDLNIELVEEYQRFLRQESEKLDILSQRIAALTEALDKALSR